MADKVSFFETDADVIKASLVARFEAMTGRQLQPAQAEQLIFDAVAYRMSLEMIRANETANKCFVLFATGPALDNLGVLLGVRRLAPVPATCTLRFQLVTGHGSLLVPAGLRVATTDGQAIFITTQGVTVDPSDSHADLPAECTTEGKVGNGYAAGQVAVIMDPQSYIVSAGAANLATTANGADEESDDELRERILLAPSQFSVAGPKDAYKFYAKSAHPNIVDVAVTIGHDATSGDVIPGRVDIFPLMADGTAPDTAIIDAIQAICNDEKRRPLCDEVVVRAPENLDYAIEVNLVLLTGAVEATVLAKVQTALEAYRDARKQRLGMDVVLSQLIAAASTPGVYKATIVHPTADVVAAPYQYSNCTGITVNVTGSHDE